jgi:CBS domain containing-hemolysin-like protein
VVGELVPKIFAIQKAEPLALLLARPLTIFFKITFPFSWLLNRSALFVTGLFGLKGISPEQANRSEAELRLILSEGYKSGIINPSEFRYVTNIFELDDVAVKGIMVPRMDICFASLQHSIQDFINSTEGATFDLYPVTLEEDKDRIVGHVSIKEILTDYIRRGTDPGQSIEPYVKPVIQVIETISAQELLLKMQKDHVQIAILLDEYGGTSGLITIKDIIRKIVGENERDTEGLPMVEKISEGRYYLSAKLLLKDVNRLLKTELEDEGIHTLGGWLLAQKYDIHEGDCVSIGKYDFVVTDMENKQIKRAEAIMRGKEGESRSTG